MDYQVKPVTPSVIVPENKDFKCCSHELVLDYSVMNFPNYETSKSQPAPILNHFW